MLDALKSGNKFRWMACLMLCTVSIGQVFFLNSTYGKKKMHAHSSMTTLYCVKYP